jgi:hypothetical protein
MNTGITSLSKLSETAAIYPFQGFEIAFSIFVALFFLVFIVRQLLMEAKHHKDIIGSFTASPAE